MIDKVMTAVTILMLMLVLPGGGVRADSAQDYWPAWRGPMASGVSPTAKPLTWSETQNIKWKAAVPGEGTSSPIVWADRILFLTVIETDRQGTPAPVERPAADANAPASSSGSKPPKNVYKFDVVCLDRATGEFQGRFTYFGANRVCWAQISRILRYSHIHKSGGCERGQLRQFLHITIPSDARLNDLWIPQRGPLRLGSTHQGTWILPKEACDGVPFPGRIALYIPSAGFYNETVGPERRNPG